MLTTSTFLFPPKPTFLLSFSRETNMPFLMDLIFHLLFLVFLNVSLVNSLNEEGLALLSFRQSILNSTASSLNNWNSSDNFPCFWNGITCENQKVVSLNIPNKGLSGFLLLDLGKLVALQHINLRNNRFYGSLPAGLFNSTALKSLILSGNSFSGAVPEGIGNLKYIQNLDLSQNSFNGSIPSSVVQCKRLKRLSLSQNRFSGPFPDGFGSNLIMLQRLNLSFNNITGQIPGNLGNLSNLQGVVDLSHNSFSGLIPESLGNLPEFVYINLSYNNLTGPIPQSNALVNAGPTAFIGNPLLCGPPLKTPCHLGTDSKPFASEPSEIARRHHWTPSGVLAIVAGAVMGTVLIGFCFSYWYKKVYVQKKSKSKEGFNPEDKANNTRKDMFCFRTDDLESLSENMEQYTFVRLDGTAKFDLEQLLKASAFLLGKSGVGIVYKVVVEKGLTVAVRRLEDGGSQRFKEFQNEVEAIGRIRHPNIVSLLAYCWCLSEKLLIYEYIPNGDLATAIHGRSGMMHFKPLTWSVRFRIIKGVAKGLAFLHEFGPKRYVHGNLKPSNILLGENMEPRISDFGLHHLACTTEESMAFQFELAASGGTSQQSSPYALTPTNARTLGLYYEAPEAMKTATKPSQKWDVYSFGVIVLEMISGKSPVMQICSSEMDLVRWVQQSIEVKPLCEILDPFLANDLGREKEMVAVLKIALGCVNGSPEKRPSMRNVSDALARLSTTPI